MIRGRLRNLRVGHQGLCFRVCFRSCLVNKGHMLLHGIVQTSDDCRGMLIVQSACCLQFDARHGPVIALVWPACDGAELSGDLDEHCPFDAHCPQLCHRRFLVSDNVLVFPRPQQSCGICDPVAKSASWPTEATSANPRLLEVAFILEKSCNMRRSGHDSLT